MIAPTHHIAFGPVPSRRLGRSLGINNVPAKTCSYACVYCQLGPTTAQTTEPQAFFTPGQVANAVATRLQQVTASGAGVDFLTFVPDGEPTLDARLGESIAAVRTHGIPVAVISNASLLWRPEVRNALSGADLVSIKLDSVDEAVWRRINRPPAALGLAQVLEGIRRFAADFGGRLVSDTMLISGLNDSPEPAAATADFLAGIRPHTAYLAVPTRPTAVAELRGPDEVSLLRVQHLFASRLERVELLVQHETGAFAHTGNARDDLLAVTAVHPMREDDLRRLLAADHAEWSLVESLLAEGALKALSFEGETYFLRPVPRSR